MRPGSPASRLPPFFFGSFGSALSLSLSLLHEEDEEEDVAEAACTEERLAVR